MACKKSFSRLLIVSIGFLFLAACGGGDGGTATPATVTRIATLTQAAEIPAPTPPPAGSEINGTATFTLNTVTNVITGTLTITGATTRVQAAHIHVGPVGGPPGGIEVGLAETAAGSGVWVVPAGFPPLTAAQAALFQSGGYYVNAHTVLNAPGEIRGQLVP
jgi:hypothetical protein